MRAATDLLASWGPEAQAGLPFGTLLEDPAVQRQHDTLALVREAPPCALRRPHQAPGEPRSAAAEQTVKGDALGACMPRRLRMLMHRTPASSACFDRLTWTAASALAQQQQQQQQQQAQAALAALAQAQAERDWPLLRLPR